jgi:Tol biopolymer transport system component
LEGPQPAGIYLKTIGSEGISLLVPVNNDFLYGPVWSPDGRTIAFLRRHRNKETWLCLTGPRGGAEKQLVRLHDKVLLIANNRHLSWSLDGERILAPVQTGEYEFAISWIRISDGVIQPVTQSADSSHAPALSPDGRAFVYLKNYYSDPANEQMLLRQDLKPDGSAAGPPLELFRGRGLISGVDWTRNGEDLVLCKGDSGFNNPQLYRMPARPGEHMTPIMGSTECAGLAVSHSNENGRTILVYGRNRLLRTQLWKARLDDLEHAVPFAPSSRSDQLPSFSPDGALVAFGSSRDGTGTIWVADTDGNDPRRISDLPHLGGPIEWSSDGKQLLFASRRLGLAFVSLTGGDTNIIKVGAAPIAPHWSHGSGFIYYPSGTWIFRVRPDGRDRTLMFEMVRDESPILRTSPDGRFIYRAKKEGLFRRPAVPGADEELIQPNLSTPWIAATRTALYYVRREDSSLYALPFAGGSAQKIGFWRTAEGRGGNLLYSFTVSPDDRTVVWSAGGGQDVDLEMVVDFP